MIHELAGKVFKRLKSKAEHFASKSNAGEELSGS